MVAVSQAVCDVEKSQSFILYSDIATVYTYVYTYLPRSMRARVHECTNHNILRGARIYLDSHYVGEAIHALLPDGPSRCGRSFSRASLKSACAAISAFVRGGKSVPSTVRRGRLTASLSSKFSVSRRMHIRMSFGSRCVAWGTRYADVGHIEG